MVRTTSEMYYGKWTEPLTTKWTEREKWVDEQGKQTAQAHRSYLAANTSTNTIHNMHKTENFVVADADGGGTIDKSEFGALVQASGGIGDGADMMALFAEMDKDGDGELTADEIEALQLRKAAALREENEKNSQLNAQAMRGMAV